MKMRRFKSITAIILTLILILSLTGCGEIKKAETAVNGMFTAFKNLDFEEAQKYVNVDEITKAGEEANEILGNSGAAIPAHTVPQNDPGLLSKTGPSDAACVRYEWTYIHLLSNWPCYLQDNTVK